MACKLLCKAWNLRSKFAREKLSNDSSAIEPFKEKLTKELEDFLNDVPNIREHIYNCDETRLFWHCLPTCTLLGGSESSASGFKKAKERVTLLLTPNAIGSHKLQFVMVGKFKKPHCFTHCYMDSFPVKYRSQRNA